MNDKEICICAAIKWKKNIIRGHRHSDCIRKSQLVIPAWPLPIKQPQQGFITSKNRFVSRSLGAKLQNKAKIVSIRTGKSIHRILFSEDLY